MLRNSSTDGIKKASEYYKNDFNVIERVIDQFEYDTTFIDIYAEGGILSMFAAEFASRVIAVEPNIDLYRILEANVR